MRILGAVLVVLLLAACSDGASSAGRETSDPGKQEEAGLAALRSAKPAMTSALSASSSTFGGMHLPCDLGNNTFEYSITGGLVADAASWRSGVDALTTELADAGWELKDTIDDTSVAGTREGLELLVQRGRRTDDGVEWRVSLTAPCVAFSDAGADRARARGTVDLSGEL
jgi:hypothetical protein